MTCDTQKKLVDEKRRECKPSKIAGVRVKIVLHVKSCEVCQAALEHAAEFERAMKRERSKVVRKAKE